MIVTMFINLKYLFTRLICISNYRNSTSTILNTLYISPLFQILLPEGNPRKSGRSTSSLPIRGSSKRYRGNRLHRGGVNCPPTPLEGQRKTKEAQLRWGSWHPLHPHFYYENSTTKQTKTKIVYGLFCFPSPSFCFFDNNETQ